MKRVNIKCPYCGSRAYLRPASVVYGQKASASDAPLYVCARFPACDSYVAAHKSSRRPMGTLPTLICAIRGSRPTPRLTGCGKAD